MYIKVKNLFVSISLTVVTFGFYFLIKNKDNMNEFSFAMLGGMLLILSTIILLILVFYIIENWNKNIDLSLPFKIFKK